MEELADHIHQLDDLEQVEDELGDLCFLQVGEDPDYLALDLAGVLRVDLQQALDQVLPLQETQDLLVGAGSDVRQGPARLLHYDGLGMVNEDNCMIEKLGIDDFIGLLPVA